MLALRQHGEQPTYVHEWPLIVGEKLARQVIALYNDCNRTEDILGYTEALSSREGRKVAHRLAEAVRRREKRLFTVRDGQRLIGMAVLTPNPLPNCRHIVEWSKGVIHSDYRGKSIFKAAVRAMAERSQEMGWEIATLDVREGTRSHKLWSAIGFRQYGRLPDYARVHGEVRAGVFMYAATAELVRLLRPTKESVRDTSC